MPTDFERTFRLFYGGKNGDAKLTLDEAHLVVAALGAAIRESLRRKTALRIPGLGTFRRTTRKAREVPNPNRFMNDWDAGEGDSMPVGYIRLPETRSVRFSPCREWRRSLK